MPLIRVEGNLEGNNESRNELPEQIRDGKLLRASKTTRTRCVEQNLGLGEALYFYVGHACPAFGDCVFVYTPEVSNTWAGTVTPFDTGGLVGYIHGKGIPETKCVPEEVSEPDWQALRAYIKARIHSIDVWRDEFRKFIDEYFAGRPDNYVAGARPVQCDADQRHPDLRNERRAWTWELQVHSDHELFDGLILCCMSDDKRTDLRKRLGVLDPRWKSVLREMVRPPQGQGPCGHVEGEIVRTLQ